MNFPKRFLAASLLALLSVPVCAESRLTTGVTSPVVASAKLDFQIEIPKVLFLRVGTGADHTTNASVNLIVFSVSAANVGDASAVAATIGSGDLGNGTVTAKVSGNNGTITFTSSTLGPLLNGNGDTISHSQIAASVASLTSLQPLAHPALVDNATTSISVTPDSGGLVNRDARWTFSYLNQIVAAPGVYGGINSNNGRVSYTASMP